MVARVGTLAVGTRFVTTLTGRGGRVLNTFPLDTAVQFDDGTVRLLHSDVCVQVVHEDFVH